MSVCPCGKPDPVLRAIGVEAWCASCLAEKVRQARAALGMCHCGQFEGPHDHREAS